MLFEIALQGRMHRQCLGIIGFPFPENAPEIGRVRVACMKFRSSDSDNCRRQEIADPTITVHAELAAIGKTGLCLHTDVAHGIVIDVRINFM